MSFFDSFYTDIEPLTIKNISETYESLDAKSSHAALRPIQKECISLLDEKLDQKDVILKLSTGSGKTTIGLLYLKYYGHKYEEPTVFLVPNLQLAKQVAQEANSLGIAYTLYGQGDRYVDHDAMRGNSIIISTYDKLFNGINTFQTYNINPCAIVFDDVHSGVDIVRKQFTLSGSSDCYTDIINLFKEACSSYDSMEWLELQNANASFEIPYWIWSDKLPKVIEILEKYKEEFKFSYPLVKNDLEFCRCVLSENKFEITTDVVNIKRNRPYYETKHKLFMSATLNDSENFIRTLGINKVSFDSVVSPESDKGIGERMILVPSLVSIDFNRTKIIEICKDFSQTYSVFILTSSTPQANDWLEVGAKLLNSENIEDELNLLKQSTHKKGLYIMAQRFEGLDLADDLCRILVIDDIPFGERLIDNYDSNCLGDIGGYGKKNIFRIEQGMGRAVRSHVDYAVVLLAGDDLSSFIAQKQCREALSTETNGQLELGIKMTKKVAQSPTGDKIEIFKEVMNGCLTRDPGWKHTYSSAMKKLVKINSPINNEVINASEKERLYYESSFDKQYFDHKDDFNDSINQLDDSPVKAKFIESFARIVNFYDFGMSQKLQAKARQMNNKLLKPNTILPRKITKEATPAGINIANIIEEYSELNGLLLNLKNLRQNFGFSEKNSKIIEVNFKKLGDYLGANSSNPEIDLKNGPDVCWYLDNKVFVIEIKHNKTAPLTKSDAGQLAVSTQWTLDHYLPLVTVVPVTVTNVKEAQSDAIYADETLILDQKNTEKLIDDLIDFYTSIVASGYTSSSQISSELLSKNLDSNSILKVYFKNLKNSVK